VDALTGYSESICDVSDTTWLVEIPAHPELSGREEFIPVYVAVVRTQSPI
jgi:hypothetical protein